MNLNDRSLQSQDLNDLNLDLQSSLSSQDASQKARQQQQNAVLDQLPNKESSTLLERRYIKFLEKGMDLDHKKFRMEKAGTLRVKKNSRAQSIVKFRSTGWNKRERFQPDEVRLREDHSCNFRQQSLAISQFGISESNITVRRSRNIIPKKLNNLVLAT